MGKTENKSEYHKWQDKSTSFSYNRICIGYSQLGHSQLDLQHKVSVSVLLNEKWGWGLSAQTVYQEDGYLVATKYSKNAISRI